MPLDTVPLADFSTLTATGVLGWYAWHTAAHTLPALVQAFRDEMAAARAECGAQRAALHAELAAERAQRHADQQRIVAALERLSERS